jgi:hypothetical protein
MASASHFSPAPSMMAISDNITTEPSPSTSLGALTMADMGTGGISNDLYTPTTHDLYAPTTQYSDFDSETTQAAQAGTYLQQMPTDCNDGGVLQDQYSVPYPTPMEHTPSYPVTSYPVVTEQFPSVASSATSSADQFAYYSTHSPNLPTNNYIYGANAMNGAQYTAAASDPCADYDEARHRNCGWSL